MAECVLEKVTGPVPGAPLQRAERQSNGWVDLSEASGAAQAGQGSAVCSAAGMGLLSRLISAPYSLP